MARVTKINVGGTNYDIAHEGELKNSGFEVVTALPTTGLFKGRQVFYNGQEHIYNGVVWCNQLDPLQKLYIPFEINYRTLDQLNSMSQVIHLENNQISQIPELLAGRQWTSVFSQILRKSEFNCEIKRGDADWVNYEWLFWEGQSISLPKGTEIRITTHKLANFANNSLTQAFFMDCHQVENVVELKIEYLNYKNLSGDNDINNEANYEWRPIFKKELKTYTTWVFPAQVFVKTGSQNSYAKDIRLTLRVVSGNLYIKGLDFYLQTQKGQTVGTTPFLINYNSTIEPTQTGEVFKTNKWILQYLTQGVNWLKANYVRASDTKLDKRAYNQIYTNCGYTNITSSTTGALIIELPFAPSNDANNSMTYIELNVYSHRKGCSKYIIGVYSSSQYSQYSQYEWSAYSYMGYNYFSSIAQARRTDNNNIVIVLGEFTDVHKNEHFSISRIVTGFNRNNDDTDGFLLYTDSNSNNYSTLISSTYISPIISYNDLTDTPNLATVATSGDYNDLLNRPALVFQNIGGTISLVQIPDGLIANSKLSNSSMSLNGITVNLGDTAILPWYVDYNEVDYPARIRDHWLQIYRNGVWANLMYLGDILPTQVGQITSLDNLDWYNEQVSEYEVDSNTTTSILTGTTLPAAVLLNCSAEQLTLNLYPISGKQYGKGSLDSLISDLQGKGFSVFVENDLDAILASGNDYLVRIKISKVPTPKAIIECYVAR